MNDPVVIIKIDHKKEYIDQNKHHYFYKYMLKRFMFLPKVILHPLSIKAINAGHSWVTQDQYTKLFPKSLFLLGSEKNSKEFHLLIQDPNHPKVKARVWINKYNSNQYSSALFLRDLEQRIEKSFVKRSMITSRDNVYLSFGEADELPGLFIQRLGQTLLIQTYSYFWSLYETELAKITRKLLPKTNAIYFQMRNSKQEVPHLIWGKASPSFMIKELEIMYQIHLKDYYDHGIYTDMSAVRSRISPKLFKGRDVLNLYCYTGAFSLLALKHQANRVVSVDLSKKYLQWLEENIQNNSQLDPTKHESINSKCESYLKKDHLFDFIISDPPSFSSNGAKSSSSMKQYEIELPLMFHKLKPSGHVLIFLNTHQISSEKFEENIKKILKPFKYQIIERYTLSDDCPRSLKLPEGDYLKGLLIKKN